MSMRKSRASSARDVALLRYSLIRPLADPALTAAERGLLVRELAAGVHVGPSGESVRVSRSTVDRWIRAWRVGGFDALLQLRQTLKRLGRLEGTRLLDPLVFGVVRLVRASDALGQPLRCRPVSVGRACICAHSANHAAELCAPASEAIPVSSLSKRSRGPATPPARS